MAGFASVKDPSGSETRCGMGVKTPCQYTFGNAAPTADDYEICFKLERPSPQFGTSDENLFHIGPGQQIAPSCSISAAIAYAHAPDHYLRTWLSPADSRAFCDKLVFVRVECRVSIEPPRHSRWLFFL